MKFSFVLYLSRSSGIQLRVVILQLSILMLKIISKRTLDLYLYEKQMISERDLE